MIRLIKVIGKTKDESEGKITDEFVGLKSKMYSVLSDDGKESNTAKRVNIAPEFNEFNNIIICFWWQKICFRWWCSYTYLFSWRLKKIDSHRWS